jgi:hypothetical protein
MEEQWNGVLTQISILGGMQPNVSDLAEIKSGKERGVAELRKNLEQIARNGVLVKDLEIGLIDFPTLFDGREVYLCWKLGEPNIGFWHDTTEGFAGRKSIDQDFLARHSGDKPH